MFLYLILTLPLLFIIIIIMITITINIISIITKFVYVKSDYCLLQFQCHMSFDVKFSYMIFYLQFICTEATTFY